MTRRERLAAVVHYYYSCHCESSVNHDATGSLPVDFDAILVAFFEFVELFLAALERRNGGLRLEPLPVWPTIQTWIPPFLPIAVARNGTFLRVTTLWRRSFLWNCIVVVCGVGVKWRI